MLCPNLPPMVLQVAKETTVLHSLFPFLPVEKISWYLTNEFMILATRAPTWQQHLKKTAFLQCWDRTLWLTGASGGSSLLGFDFQAPWPRDSRAGIMEKHARWLSSLACSQTKVRQLSNTAQDHLFKDGPLTVGWAFWQPSLTDRLQISMIKRLIETQFWVILVCVKRTISDS